ncbi:hypothetical protein HG536_0E02740 [Torulaspora globosa]|uniref:Uncharacterized protein n=1 Tax=Torulaspora globosa TaxID=48254 RepID=A0A7G3ZIM7_9SACH|nr:uncharacterized protein HG536_0E02740 [Torulaspora globosa]QLL33363.1 hypothetical protein HG536_0E02740 [Torulaspora globosa]
MTAQENMIVHRSRFVEFSAGNITALAFSHKSDAQKLTPSELRLALGRSDGSIEIWNPRENWFQELVIHSGRDRSIEALCWRNVPGEALRLFSIGGSTAVTEWDLATGLPLKNHDCNAGVIWSMAINECQDKLAVGCDNGTVVIIDVSGGPGCLEYDTILTRQEARILTLAWNKDDYVIGGCSDGRIRVWSALKGADDRGRIIHTMKVDKSKKESTLVWSVLYLPQSHQIVSGDSTGSVKFWDWDHATLTQSFKTHMADVLTLTRDVAGNSVFSAGVDRKIFHFQRNHNGAQKDAKWVNTSNRLIHGNDVRALCSYQSKGADFLVSGGVEKCLIINSLSAFADGKYRKMPLLASISKNMIINREQRLVVSWYASTVRIWHVGQDFDGNNNYRLVCKMVLKDEQNITTCAISPDGQVLVVARPSLTKLFHLQPLETKLKVTKLDNSLLLRTGCSLVQFIDNSRIAACSTDGELFTVDLESDQDDEMSLIELPEVPQTKSSAKIPYMNKINHLVVGGDLLVVGRTCGAVDIVNQTTNESRPLVRLMNFITAMLLNKERESIILVTAENKIYEFNLKSGKQHSSLLTDWSKNNTDNLPMQLQKSTDKVLGISYTESDPNMVWFWSSSWISRINFSQDLPLSNRRKAKKHDRDGLTITDDSNFMDDLADVEDENNLELTEALQFLSSHTRRFKPEGTSKSKDEKSFFFTDKYKLIYHADLIAEKELIIVEKPSQAVGPHHKAVDLPKLLF